MSESLTPLYANSFSQGWELGLPFFVKYYVTYDFENMQVGLSLGCNGDCINRQCKEDAPLDISDYLLPKEKHHDAPPIKSAVQGPAEMETAKKGNIVFVVFSVLIVLLAVAVVWGRRKRKLHVTASTYHNSINAGTGEVEEIGGHLSIDIQMLDAMN